MTDQLQRFIFEDSDIKGAIVRLSDSTHQIMEQHAYPQAIRELLAQVITASTLLMSTLKLEGQITLQFQQKNAIKLLVAKCSSELAIRGMCHWENDALPGDYLSDFSQGELIVTLEDLKNEHRYQSIIPLDQGPIENAIDLHFAQSDQLPTRVRLFYDNDNAYGFLLQQMPSQVEAHQDTWHELSTFVSTLTASDFTENTDNTTLLKKLFAEHSLRLFDPKPVQFKCTCSYDKMTNTLKTLGKEEANAILSTHKTINITCDYCNNSYDFLSADVTEVFNDS